MTRHIHINTEKARPQCGAVSSGEVSSGQVSFGQVSGGILAYLGWVQLWLSCLTENLAESLSQNMNRGFAYLRAFEAKALQDAADIASGKIRAPALIPESERVPEAPKIMLSRSTKRMLARGLPISRQYGWFRYASSRTLNGNQFYELLARMSVHGRASLYRLEYKGRLCTRRPRNMVLREQASAARLTTQNLGLCAAHLWPN